MASVGLGEFAFEEGRDGVDAVVTERGETGETELAGPALPGHCQSGTARAKVSAGVEATPADEPTAGHEASRPQAIDRRN